MKKKRVGFLMGAFVLASLGLVAWVCFCPRVHRRPPSVQHLVEDEIPGHPTPEKIGWEGAGKIDFNVPASRVQELKSIFSVIADAYTNGQFEVARRRLSEAPDDFRTLPGTPYKEVTDQLLGPFYDFLFRRDEGLYARPLTDFTSVAEFTSYMRFNFELTHFFYVVQTQRAHPPNKVNDPNMLYQLKCYRKKFNEEGKSELERVAKDFYDEWCERVESRDGYTRRFMWDLMGRCLYNRKHNPNLWMSNKQIMKAVRHQADDLNRMGGYTPKWLDEEFPSPPEEEPTSPKKEVPR